MKKIFVIEDDSAIAKGLCIALREDGFDVDSESDGLKAYKKVLAGNFDIILLDIMLPSKNGIDICRDLRKEDVMVPIIMLTSKKEEIDKVLGLEIGADDYVTKPFSVRELSARIKAILRRAEKVKSTEIEEVAFADIKINFKRHEIFKKKKEVKLSSTEFSMLHFFINHEGEVITREKLLDEVWGYENYPTTRTVDNFILSLRKHLEDDPSNPKHFITLHKTGYKFVK